MEKTMMAENEKMSSFAREGAHYDNLTRAADHFGIENQACKAVEEVGEFLAEFGRAMNGATNKDELVEETADVYNLLDQLCYLFGIEEDVREVAEIKMERTVKGVQRNPNNVEISCERFEEICEQIHNGWWAEKINQGIFDHPDMKPYSELEENVKEYDRVTLRRVLDALGVSYDG